MTGSECRFANGPFAGVSLGEAWREMPPEWVGTTAGCGSDFPLLVKFIFSEEKLSVQVHPDDDYAVRHEQTAGACGKTEMWYVVRARPEAEVLVGLKPGVTRESFERAIAEGTAEDCLTRVQVQAGDAVFVPAGTAHTIGPGLLLCEIQQQSDLTYRVYDYNRRNEKGEARPLHVEKALEAMRFGKQTGGKIEPVRVERGSHTEAYLAVCRYFAAEKWEFSSCIQRATSREHFELLIFLVGSGNIRWGTESMEYGPAETWMIPAALGDFHLIPSAHTALLRTYAPCDMNEFSRRLVNAGASQRAISRIAHP